VARRWRARTRPPGAPCSGRVRSGALTRVCSSDDDCGFVELVVKVYFRGVNANFPDGGLMSQHMEQLKLGDKARRLRKVPQDSAATNPLRAACVPRAQGEVHVQGTGDVCSQAACVAGARHGPLRPTRRLTLLLRRHQGGGEKLRKCTQLGMIAGGTGITPMLQVRCGLQQPVPWARAFKLCTAAHLGDHRRA